MLLLLKSKLLKQSDISNKKECHPLPTPILFINIILIILYLLDKITEFVRIAYVAFSRARNGYFVLPKRIIRLAAETVHRRRSQRL